MHFFKSWPIARSSVLSWLPNPWWLCPLRLTGAFAALLALGCAAMAIDGEIGEQQVISQLRQGGHVIYLRHASRFRGPREGLSQWSSAAQFANCRDQRNLTPEGQEEARQIGQYWRELGIPVGRVIANAQCRTRDTAILAFGRTQIDQRLYDLDFMRSVLLEPVEEASNTVVIASDFQLRELTGIDLDYAEAAVIAPDGLGGIKVIARLDLDDWEDAADPSWWDLF